MHALNIDAFLRQETLKKTKGPIAIIGIEDDVEIASTLRHHIDLGFSEVIALMPSQFELPRDLESNVMRINHEFGQGHSLANAVTRLQAAAPEGTWTFFCFNGEYLFYPFCESRTVVELLAFHTEERRDAMLTFVVDLYADDLDHFPNAVSVDHAHLDRTGYYALARTGGPHGHPVERQLDFFGGLRWRFEEHVPPDRRRIDRISLFRSGPRQVLRDDFTFQEDERNTYACPWHNNLTAAVCSFRTAKAMKRNPGSRSDIETFKWRNSEPFRWHSQQLMDLGLMEPGQWF